MVAVAASALVATVATVDPNQAGNYPTCPFLALTGLYCPGCGSLRALHALAHGDALGAVALNPLMVAMMPILVWCWLRWVRRIVSRAQRHEPAPAFVLYCFAFLVVGFWVARNLPAGAALAP